MDIVTLQAKQATFYAICQLSNVDRKGAHKATWLNKHHSRGNNRGHCEYLGDHKVFVIL